VRTAFIGDVHGELGLFLELLNELDVNMETGEIPSDLRIVQLGDLVHKGTHSDQCVELADHLVRNSPSHWVQLFGNHELAEMDNTSQVSLDGSTILKESSRELIRSWWADRLASLAYPLVTKDETVLVSHAGLTLGCWKDIGAPENAIVASKSLNQTVGSTNSPAFNAGKLKHGEVNTSSGPCWAEVNFEFYLPWIVRKEVPFSQIHGHAAPWNWNSSSYWPNTPELVRSACTHDPETRRVMTTLGVLPSGEIATALSLDWLMGGFSKPRTWPIFVVHED
jgi:hypothetical protein